GKTSRIAHRGDWFGEPCRVGAAIRSKGRGPDAMGGRASETAPSHGSDIAMSRIDLARDEDVAAIAAIERRVFSDPWSERAFRDVLAHPAMYFACVRERTADGYTAECVRGYVVAWFAGGQGEIANLAVDESAR